MAILSAIWVILVSVIDIAYNVFGVCSGVIKSFMPMSLAAGI